MKWLRIAMGLTLLALRPAAAAPHYATWSARLVPGTVRAGEGAQVVVTAHIQRGWHLYSLTQPAGGPVKTTIVLDSGPLAAGGPAVEPAPTRKFDPGFKMNIEIYQGAVAFGVPVSVKPGSKGDAVAHLKIRYQVCNENTCMPPETVELKLPVKVSAGKPRNTHPVTTVPKVVRNVPAAAGTLLLMGGPTDPPSASANDDYSGQVASARAHGLLAYIGLSLVAGLGALLTPCVFPMIPITVSFFAKRKDKTRRDALTGAIAYCAGIVATFTALGLAATVLFGASGISRFAANPFVNIALAVVFILLAANLVGAFEIAAPTALANRANARAQAGGLVAPLLMGLTFTLTSFTCTVPFVGTLLVTATHGSLLYPVVGMLAFSSAFALPFFLLALFPQALERLPRAGAWMVSFKSFMGLLELAAALKFLSNADLVWQRGLLTRPVFLGVWAILGVIGGLYLVGWIRFPHDMDTARIGWLRRLFGVGSAAAGIYCLAAINGAPLGQFTAFVPPDPYPGRLHAGAAQSVAGAPEPWIPDYVQAATRAHDTGKPIFLNFTGVTCTNCRQMENNMFPQPEVAQLLNRYVKAELYTDRDTPADNKNKDLEEKLTGVVTLPVYVALSPEGKIRKVFQGLTTSTDAFTKFLRAGLDTGGTPVSQ